VILDKGRNMNEKSYVYYKDNKVYAIGFVENEDENMDIDNIVGQDDLVINNFYMNHLAESYATLYPNKVLQLKAVPSLE